MTLHKGSLLGLVTQCTAPVCGQTTVQGSQDNECGSGALVGAVSEDNDRFERLVSLLEISANKLNRGQMWELRDMLHEYSDIFALTDQELGCTSIVRHSIDTGEHRPIKRQPYRTPITRRDTIKQMVNQMQHQGVVQPSMSAWASPVVLVPKKDGSLRFCVDYRQLNSITRKDVFPLPRVDDNLDTFNGTNFFTSLDLASGYWQIELDDDARAKSAFTTYNGLYEFVRMPFGLCNAPATFQRVMQVILAGLEGKGVFVYLDDILIASKSFSEHIGQFKEVFDHLRSAGLRLKPKKCLLLHDEVPYLGHVVSAQGVKPDLAKTEKVKSFPVPLDVTGVRQFIGLASYYRRFVPSFASIASPLHSLTKKNSKFSWTAGCQAAFDKLKELLVSAPVLAYPRFGQGIQFVLETDASGVGLGAVLSQTQADGQLHPVAYASRSLDTSERNYGITELETLAVVWAVRYFRPYLLGHHTTVFTDHSACVSVLSTARPAGKIARWALTMQEFDLTLKHRAGKLNANADALSRNPIPISESDRGSCDDYCSCNCSGVKDDVFGNQCVLSIDASRNESVVSHDDDIKLCESKKEIHESVSNDEDIELCESKKEIHQMQMKDVDLQAYINYHSHGLLPEDQKVARKIVLESQRYEMIDGVLYHENPNHPGRWCIVVPTELR